MSYLATWLHCKLLAYKSRVDNNLVVVEFRTDVCGLVTSHVEVSRFRLCQSSCQCVGYLVLLIAVYGEHRHIGACSLQVVSNKVSVCDLK